MAGRESTRSRPARSRKHQRRSDDEDDSTNGNDEETEQYFHKNRPKKRKRLDVNLKVDSLSPCIDTCVVGGCPAQKGQFPYQVALHLTRNSGDVARGGGTIIANQWILTAAHLCNDARKVVIFAGAHPTQKEAQQSVEADLIVMQEAYKTENATNKFIIHDIALLHLKEPLKNTDLVKPISLPSEEEAKCDFAGKVAVLSGWGKTGETDEKPKEGTSLLNYAYEKILDNAEAAKMLKVDKLPDTILAAIGTSGKACSCNGDSGGPLALKGIKGKQIIVGIVSHRIGKCGGPVPHLLTRVTSYMDWIKKIINSTLKDTKP